MNPYYNNPEMDMDQIIELLKKDPNYIDSDYNKKYEFLLDPSSKPSAPGTRQKVNKRVLEHLLKGADFHNKRLLEHMKQASNEKLDRTVDDGRTKANEKSKNDFRGKERRRRSELDVIHGILSSEQSKKGHTLKQLGSDYREHHSHSKNKREELERTRSGDILESRGHYKERCGERRHRKSSSRSLSPERRSSCSSRSKQTHSDKKSESSREKRSSHNDYNERRSRRNDKHERKRRDNNDGDIDRPKMHNKSTDILSQQSSKNIPTSFPKSIDSSTNRSKNKDRSSNIDKVRKKDLTGAENSFFCSSPEIHEDHTDSSSPAGTPIIMKGRGSTNSDAVNSRFSQAYDPKKDFTTSKVSEVYGPSLEGAVSFQFSKGSGRTLSDMLKNEPQISDAKYSQTESVSWPKYSKGEREWDFGK